MGKLSAEQQATLDQLNALADAPDTDEDEVWVENAQGHKTRLVGGRAQAWLKRNGYGADDPDGAADDADKSAGGAAKKAGAAKKVAPVKAGAQPPGDDGTGDLADPPPPGPKRSFF